MKYWILFLALLAPAVGRAQPYSVGWFKIAGGGGTSTNGAFTINGTFGQHDAGGPMAGGGFSVVGGFWSPLAPPLPPGTVPSITTQPQSQSAGNSSQVNFSAGAAGTPPIYYQWQLNGTNLTDGGGIAGCTTTNLVLNTALGNYYGYLSLIVVSAYGSATSSVAALAPADGTPLWTNIFNRTVINSPDVAKSLALDASGNIYVTGQSGISGGDYATIKYSSAGVPLWTNFYNGTGNNTDEAFSLAVDASGNVYVTGRSAGSGSGFDYATIKYSSAGVPLWTNIYNGAGNSDDEATSLALDGTGNVYVTGYSDSGTSYDYATIKYSSAGVPLWTNIYNGAGNGTDEALSLAVDGTGNVYVTGESVGIGSGFDYATIKYSSAGVPLWTNTYNGAGNSTDEALSIAVDGSGNVYVTGESTGSGIGFDYATIRYAGPPNATVITPPASATVALSSNATFTATAGGFQPLAVQWQFNGNAIAGATNNSLTISNAGFAAAGSYQVIVSNTFGSATSAVAVLTVTGNLALDTFDPSPYGNGFYFGGDATNVSVGIVPGVGLGGTAALRARCDFNNGPNGYGFLAAQWQDGAVIGNVDTNLSHYRLAFDAYVTGDAQHQSGGGFTLVLQETAGTNFSTPFPQGTLQTYQPYQGGADLMVSHSGTWQHFDINLGGPAFMGTNGFNDNFSPTGATWQIGFQLNASDWGAEPQTGTTLIIDNLALKLGAPPVAVTESNTGFTNGQFGFNLNGVAGTWVVIQASSNLFNWTPFQTSTFGGDPLQFRDPQPAGFRMRFYRAVLLP